MMPCHRLTSRGINRRVDTITGLEPVRAYLDSMADRLTLRLDVDNTSLRPRSS